MDPNTQVAPAPPPGFSLDSAAAQNYAVGGQSPSLPEGFEPDQPTGAQNRAPSASEKPPSTGDQLFTGFENQILAGGEMTTPNMAAHAPNYLGPATVTEEGDIGYKDEQGNFQPTDVNKHVVLIDPA